MKGLEADDWLFITSCRHTRAAAGATCRCHGGPSVCFWVFKGSQRMGWGKSRFCDTVLQKCKGNKYNFYSVYIIMTEMSFSSVSAGKLLEWSTAVSEKISLDAWLMNFNLFANGYCSSPEIMEVIWPNHSTADTNTTNKHSKLSFSFLRKKKNRSQF